VQDAQKQSSQPCLRQKERLCILSSCCISATGMSGGAETLGLIKGW